MRCLNVYIFCFIGFLFSVDAFAQKEDSVLNFMVANKARSSFYAIKNRDPFIKLNEDKMMPLAHCVHLLVAIEFCKQAAADMVYPDAKVPLTDLEKYSIPNLDDANNNHDNWMAYGQSKRIIKDDSVKLIDVAKGMLMYNDEANAGYLMDLLGYDNINSNLRAFDIQKHSGLSCMVASMFLYQNGKKKEETLIKEINKMPDEMYCLYAKQLHKSIENDAGFKDKFRQKNFTPALRKVWSNRLTASTTKEYAQIAGALNRRRIFEEMIYNYVAEVMETFMESEETVKLYKTAALFEGNTNSVLTKTMYATIRKNNLRIEFAYFFNDLSQDEHDKLVKWMPDFDKQFLQNESFRNMVADKLQ